MSIRFVALLPIAFAGVALADEPAPATAVPVPGKEQAYDFDTDVVDVDVLKPDLSMVQVLAGANRQSLIRIRTDFVKEIVRSAEDL